MITDLIVYLSLGFTALFVAAWALRSDLRAWVERPKYVFLQNVRRYDQHSDSEHRPHDDD